jgi:hypothetical protein
MGLVVSNDLSLEGVRRYLPAAKMAFSAMGGCYDTLVFMIVSHNAE